MKGGVVIKLSKSQIKQMSSFISLYLQDIRDFIDKNRDNYEKWLKEVENKRIIKIYTRYQSLGTIDKVSLKMRKNYTSYEYNCNKELLLI